MKKTFYEQTLEYNSITRYLHSNKHKLFFSHLLAQGINEKNDHKITILDLGCGPAYIFNELRDRIKNFEYIGVEIRDDFINAAKENFADDNRFTIIKSSADNYLSKINKVDFIISFDCFEHMLLDARNNAINLISKIDFKYMYVNVPNEIGPAIFIKNLGSFLMRYVRHKEYTLKETIYSTLYLTNNIKPHTDGHKGFDWRVLYYNLRFYFDTVLITSPIRIVPRSLSPSIFFIYKKI